MRQASTLVDLLEQRADQDPEHVTYSFLDGFTGTSAGRETTVTNHELRRRARSVAARIRRTARPGDRVLVVHQPGLDYVIGLFACLMAGTVAVPTYPPEATRLVRGKDRVRAIVEDARPRCALIDPDPDGAGIAGLRAQLPELDVIVAVEVPDESAEDWSPSGVDRDGLVVLQYTSGSTAQPKGVMLSHGTLIANLAVGRDVYGLADDMNGVFWIPPYHDMGLIGGIFMALFCGGRTRLFAPFSFMRDPMRWVHLLSLHRASVSAAPDFAYALAARAGAAAGDRVAELDLSGWRVAISGAEPVRHSTIEKFCEVYSAAGFRRSAFHPSYGLAENTLVVTAGRGGPALAALDARELERRQARAAVAGSASRTLVGCGGSADPGQDVLVVDPQAREPRPDGEVGEVWVRGPSVAQGYWGRPAESAATFGATLAGSGAGPYLRTGDLGFLREGSLFVVGRRKDLIVLRGLNHHPHDIEQTAEAAHPQIRTGRCVAFSVDTGEVEKLVLAIELRHATPDDVQQDIVRAVREQVGVAHDVAVDEIVFVPPGAIGRTSSGKLRRSAVRAAYLEGRFAPAHSAPQAYDAPRDDVERLIAVAWSRCLGVSRVGINDGFFALGGDSLKAVGLLEELRRSTGHVFTMSDIGAAHTVAELAELLRRRPDQERDRAEEIEIHLG